MVSPCPDGSWPVRAGNDCNAPSANSNRFPWWGILLIVFFCTILLAGLCYLFVVSAQRRKVRTERDLYGKRDETSLELGGVADRAPHMVDGTDFHSVVGVAGSAQFTSPPQIVTFHGSEDNQACDTQA